MSGSLKTIGRSSSAVTSPPAAHIGGGRGRRRGRRAGRRIQWRRAGPQEVVRSPVPLASYDRQLIPVPFDNDSDSIETRIPVLVTSRMDSRAAAAAPGRDGVRPRCLARPERLSQRRTNTSDRVTEQDMPTSTNNNSGLKIEQLNVQSLLPKLPDIRADLNDRQPDVVCFTETNLKTTTPNRFIYTSTATLCLDATG